MLLAAALALATVVSVAWVGLARDAVDVARAEPVASVAHGPGSTAEGAEPSRHSVESESSNDSAESSGAGAFADGAIEIVAADQSGVAVPGVVIVLWSGPTRSRVGESITTDANGRAVVDRRNATDLLAYHANFLLTRNALVVGRQQTVVLRSRPHVFVRIEAMTEEERANHEFWVNVMPEKLKDWTGALRSVALDDLSKAIRWDGSGYLELESLLDEKLTVQVNAMSPGSPRGKDQSCVRTATAIVEAPVAGKTVTVQFSTRLPMGYGDLRLMAKIGFPRNAPLETAVHGPYLDAAAGIRHMSTESLSRASSPHAMRPGSRSTTMRPASALGVRVCGAVPRRSFGCRPGPSRSPCGRAARCRGRADCGCRKIPRSSSYVRRLRW